MGHTAMMHRANGGKRLHRPKPRSLPRSRPTGAAMVLLRTGVRRIAQDNAIKIGTPARHHTDATP